MGERPSSWTPTESRRGRPFPPAASSAARMLPLWQRPPPESSSPRARSATSGNRRGDLPPQRSMPWSAPPATSARPAFARERSCSSASTRMPTPRCFARTASGTFSETWCLRRRPLRGSTERLRAGETYSKPIWPPLAALAVIGLSLRRGPPPPKSSIPLPPAGGRVFAVPVRRQPVRRSLRSANRRHAYSGIAPLFLACLRVARLARDPDPCRQGAR